MTDVSKIADAAELRVWAKQEVYTLAALVEDLKASIDEDEYGEEEAGAESSEETQALAQKVMDEVLARQEILKGSYPFECDGYKIQLKPGDANKSTYVFCLGLSLLPPDNVSAHQRGVQFETVAMRAANRFFRGQPLRVGHPLSNGAPTYKDLFDQVIKLIPDLGSPSDEAIKRGDGGWDVLIVKSFADNKFPRLIVLGNCATSRAEWLSKGMETAPNYFWKSFKGRHESVVLTFLAVPFLMDDDDRLRKSYENAISFDRLRICEHAPESSQDIADWIESTREAALGVPLS